MRILITAGPTREHFDPVRFISNGSTGKLGYAVAREAGNRGHSVVLVSGPVALSAPPVEVVSVTSAEEMFEESTKAFLNCDVAIMTAAVSDWRPVQRSHCKAPKSLGQHTVELESTPDICAHLGQSKGHRVVIGFAVQDLDPHAKAEEKMKRKCCDAIVLNSPEAIGSDGARIEIKVGSQPWRKPQTANKLDLAAIVTDLAEELVSHGE